MRNRAVSILKSKTVRQSAITSSSTIMTAGLGAVYYLVIARILGPEKYGLFALALQIMLSLTPFADFGTGSTIVRFVGEKPDNFKSFTSAAFRVKLIGGLISILVLLIGGDFISSTLLRQPSISPLLPWVGLGVLVVVMFNFVTSVLQGLQQFSKWGSIQVGANIFRLILLGLIYLAGRLNASAGIVAFIFSFLVGLIISLRWIKKSFMFSAVEKADFQEFWKYNKWTALFTIVTNLNTRVDSFYTARYLEIAQTGIYSLSVTMSSFLPQFAASIGAVTSPKFSGFKSLNDTTIYLKKALPFTVFISFVIAFLMIPLGIGVIAFTGKDFGPAFTPFIISLISMFIYASSFPIRDCLMYAYKKPHLFFYVSLIQGVVIITSARILVPNFGIIGAAISSLISQALVASIFGFIYLRVRKVEK